MKSIKASLTLLFVNYAIISLISIVLLSLLFPKSYLFYAALVVAMYTIAFLTISLPLIALKTLNRYLVNTVYYTYIILSVSSIAYMLYVSVTAIINTPHQIIARTMFPISINAAFVIPAAVMIMIMKKKLRNTD